MTKTQKIWLGAVTGLVVVLLIQGFAVRSTLGGVYSQVNQSFREGIKVGTTDQFSVSSDGTVTVGGDITVTHTGAATSSVAVGCLQVYPTSSATAMRYVIGNNIIATTTFAAINSNFDVYAQFGSCPI